MERLTENTIEAFAIKLFERPGYSCVHAPKITPDGERSERSRYDNVFLLERELAEKSGERHSSCS